MADSGDVMMRSAQAAADLTKQQYHFLRATAAGETNVASEAAGKSPETLIGVQQNKPASGRAVTIGFFGESKVVAGGSITVNRWITSNGSGRAAAAGSGDNVIGMALVAASADGEVIRAMIFPPWRLTDTPT